MNVEQRAKQLLSLANYAKADQVVPHAYLPARWLDIPQEQYILRMMVLSPWSNGLQIPPELEWLRGTINSCAEWQEEMGLDHPFVYVTVRSGVVKSVTDDEWHVDGFSMRVPHAPEQNYVWTNVYATEVLKQQFEIPVDFDPLKHNLHWFFQDRADEGNIGCLPCGRIHQIDPYVVHRRPAVPAGTQRTFFRISFVPIEIEDDTCMPNPLIATKLYGREDIRKNLTRYGVCTTL